MLLRTTMKKGKGGKEARPLRDRRSAALAWRRFFVCAAILPTPRIANSRRLRSAS